MDPINQAAERILIVPPATPAVRLDVFLSQHTNLSRSKLQKDIKRSAILLNDQPAKPHDHVRAGDVIRLERSEAVVEERDRVSPGDGPDIVFEDENYLVVSKPSGLLVHGGPGVRGPTLADWAVAHDPQIETVGDQPRIRPGIVHRLDRDVSGVMVIAKTQAAFLDLKRQFQHHAITKEYVALVFGRLTDPTGRISFAIARKADKSGLMVARPASQEGQAAETLFTVERYVKSMTLVRIQTLTGRSHQIRVHFKAIGHPLVGDPLYRIKRMKVTKLPPPRLFLHATTLGFDDLAGQRRTFTSPLPKDLAQYLARVS